MTTLTLKAGQPRSNLVWAVVALGVILGFNLFFTPGFFTIQIRNGHLYGNLIDILTFGAPFMVLAVGMTLVIATGGVDLSVGPVAAITAAVVTALIGPKTDVTQTPLL